MINRDSIESEQMIQNTQENTQKKTQEQLISIDVLPLKNKVLFPGVIMPILVSRPRSLKLIRHAMKVQEERHAMEMQDDQHAVEMQDGRHAVEVQDDRNAMEVVEEFLTVCQKDAVKTEPAKLSEVHKLGCTARIVRVIDMHDGSVLAILQGVERMQLMELDNSGDYLRGKGVVKRTIYANDDDAEFNSIASQVKKCAIRLISRMENIPQEARVGMNGLTLPPLIVNFVCANFSESVTQKQQWLAISSMMERALAVLDFLNKEDDRLRVTQDIQNKTKEELDKSQREYYLHQQMQAIQKELGDTSEKDSSELAERAKSKHWDDSVKAVFEAELQKLQRMNMHAPEYAMQLNYLDVLLSLPWNEYTEDNLDIVHAQEVLNKDHYGMDDVKDRILEHLAVLQQLSIANAARKTMVGVTTGGKGAGVKTPGVKTPILCLYGPPGVGKTSLGRSVARALGRKYARISLGGLHDEAELRGHRRTYIGAMCGRIIDNLRKVGSSNPVFILDEIDKIGADYKGDPTSALLEILDPEQNCAFHDNFLDVDYDLSQVLFIATANSLQSIPRPLLDRMELIEMTGYLQEEKVEIAKRHLLPKEMTAHGLAKLDMKFSTKTLRYLIDRYTRESGVRELDRQVQHLIRKFIKTRALGEDVSTTITEEDVTRFLGKPRYSRDMYEDNRYVGVVTGLAWTQVGGEILFIETSLSPAKNPTLTLTGNLGDVMKESATIALGYIRAHAKDFGIARKDLDSKAVHLHVPEGAIPKDGPSAGITMTTAMLSAFTGRKVRNKLAMTGEMTLRGKVLPVGGIKEKILAAKRSGITDIMLCYENEKDILEIKPEYLKGLTFHYVRDIHEVAEFALV